MKSIEFDSYNRITKVTNPGAANEVIGQYRYDDQGFRVRKLSRRETNSEERIVEVLYPSMYFGLEKQRTPEGEDIPGTVYAINNIYLNGVRVAAVIPNGKARYYLTDQVDSVKVVVNDEGQAVSRMEYMPFGDTWFQEGQESHTPKYNSQELDRETGFYFFNARHYDPGICRFTSPDTVIDGEYDTQGWNRYSYCKNNPIEYRDPTGHEGEGGGGFFSGLWAAVSGFVSGLFGGNSGGAVPPPASNDTQNSNISDKLQDAKDPTLTYGQNADKNVMNKYYENTLKNMLKDSGNDNAQIANTKRDPENQSRVMYDQINSKGVENQKSLYGDTGDQVIDVYDKCQKEGKTESETKQAMQEKIIEIESSGTGQKVSKHGGDYNKEAAIDIDPSSITNKNSFESTLQTYKAYNVIDFILPSQSESAYHIVIFNRKN